MNISETKIIYELNRIGIFNNNDILIKYINSSELPKIDKEKYILNSILNNVYNNHKVVFINTTTIKIMNEEEYIIYLNMPKIKIKFNKIDYENTFEKNKNNVNGINKIKYSSNNYLKIFFDKFYSNEDKEIYHINSFIYHLEELFENTHEILLNIFTDTIKNYKINIYLYDDNGLIYKYTKKINMIIIYLYYSDGFIYVLNDNKQFEKNNSKKIKKNVSDDKLIKNNIYKKINAYKKFDDKLILKYPDENLNLKTITSKEAYEFIKNNNITKCPICHDEILYCNYTPLCLYQFSFDRINNKQIHHINNIQITCYNCNVLKKDNINNDKNKIFNQCRKENCFNRCHLSKI